MEKKKSQKDAVFEILKDVLGDLYSPEKPMREYFDHAFGFDDRNEERLQPARYERTKNSVSKFIKMVNSCEIKRPKNCPAESDLYLYGRRIIFNWLRKDPRLNGGKKYIPSSPPRSGAIAAKISHALKQLNNDEQIDALLSLYAEISGAGNNKGMNEVKKALLSRIHEITLEELNKSKAA